MLRFDDRGLIPAVVQDDATDQVLTLAYMNREALNKTLEGPDVWFYSRSRRELWHKGETSGNLLRVKRVSLDCDMDAVLVRVEPTGPACHTGETTCFHTEAPETVGVDGAESAVGPGVLDAVFDVVMDRKRTMPADSYTTTLFEAGRARIAQKVIEEGGETALAGVSGDREHTAEEMADLLYHALVLLADMDSSPSDVWQSLHRRRR
jgi:phosphoribosyl-ATP pyrophosphohydrolase/phosphoribosyl-AMP cyclohydrolase